MSELVRERERERSEEKGYCRCIRESVGPGGKEISFGRRIWVTLCLNDRACNTRRAMFDHRGKCGPGFGNYTLADLDKEEKCVNKQLDLNQFAIRR